MNRIQTLISLAKEELYAAEILFENLILLDYTLYNYIVFRGKIQSYD